MHEELYTRVVRGILHAESSEREEPSRTYELLERLKQVCHRFWYYLGIFTCGI